LTVRLRDELEHSLRSWDAYERGRGTAPVVDYDCHPPGRPVEPAASRLDVFHRLRQLQADIEPSTDPRVSSRIRGDLAYLRALLGERAPLAEYIRQTQGCLSAGWSADYLTARAEQARASVEARGVPWDAETTAHLRAAEGELTLDQAPDAIRSAAAELEPVVRKLVDTDAPFNLAIEAAEVDAYWAYWLDGSGENARLRLNLRNAHFTDVQARVFALHEVLGHALKGASYSAQCAREDVPWVRVMSVHAHQQVLFEGLAQALPLFVIPNEDQVVARVRLAHFTQLVRAELHLAINSGTPVEECAAIARSWVPFWTDEDIADTLTDRSVNPQLRSYLWSYPAGIDWFVSLAEAGGPTAAKSFGRPIALPSPQASWRSCGRRDPRSVDQVMPRRYIQSHQRLCSCDFERVGV
jgi:hypothetical protein